MSRLLLLLGVVACGHPGGVAPQSPPAPPREANETAPLAATMQVQFPVGPECHASATSDTGPPIAHAVCVAMQPGGPAEAVALRLATLDWQRSSSELLGALREVRVSSEDWYAVARVMEAHNPRAALALLDLPATTSDRGLLVEVRLSQLRLARQVEDAERLRRSRALMLELATDGAIRLRLVNELAALDERPLVAAICKSGADPELTWACAEADPKRLPDYLHALGALPVLTYADADRLRKLAGPWLPGLRCVDGSQLPPVGVSSLVAMQAPPAVDAVVIYHRLHDGAPDAQAQCLLGESAAACLTLVAQGNTCPMLFALADYIATLRASDRDSVLANLFSQKNELYVRLRNGSPDAAAVLLHLHLMLAEVLVDTPDTLKLRMPHYHTTQAYGFWSKQPRTEDFQVLLSPHLRDTVCKIDTCQQWCATGPSYRGCVQTCTPFLPDLKRACGPT